MCGELVDRDLMFVSVYFVCILAVREVPNLMTTGPQLVKCYWVEMRVKLLALNYEFKEFKALCE